MELPVELWSNILLKTQTSNNCRKLFEALPRHIQEELRKIYEKHQEVISDNIICGIRFTYSPKKYIHSCLLFVNNQITEFIDTRILFLKFRPNYDEFVTVSESGNIRFWSTKINKVLFRIQEQQFIGNCNFEFHPNGNMIVTIIGSNIHIMKYETNRFNTCHRSRLVFGGDDPNVVFFHPTSTDLYIARGHPDTNEIIELYNLRIDIPNRIFFLNKIQLRFSIANANFPIKISPDGIFIENIMNFNSHGCPNYGGIFLHRTTILNATTEYPKKVPKINLFTDHINDFFWKDEILYYCNNVIVEKNIETENEITLYRSSEQIRKMFYKKDGILFVEKNEFKRFDLETKEISLVFNWNTEEENLILNDFEIIYN